MRTKVLCAAALAAGALTSMAQVYSANIVGYVNVSSTAGQLSFLSNPLDASPDNTAASVFPNANADQSGMTPGPFDGDNLQIWQSPGWKVYQFDSQTADTTTGFTDTFGNPQPAPSLTSGLGFLYFNGSASKTITYVGQVRTGTNVLAVPSRFVGYALGSQLPIAGGVTTALGMTNYNADQTGMNPGPLDGAAVQILQPNNTYKVYQFDSQTADTTTGFTDTFGNPQPEPQIPIAGGFIFVNGTAGTYNWTQVLNP